MNSIKSKFTAKTKNMTYQISVIDKNSNYHTWHSKYIHDEIITQSQPQYITRKEDMC